MGKGRKPCCDKAGVKKGPWSEAEDLTLISFIQKHGHSNWRALPRLAGLARCGKSCRLRWVNYLRPDLKRGNFSPQEEETIIKLHETLGNKWSKIASHFPGRTDNEIKNVWNTHLKKRVKAKQATKAPTQVEGEDSSPNQESLDETQKDRLKQAAINSPKEDVIEHSTSSSSSYDSSQTSSFSDCQPPDLNPEESHGDEMVIDNGFLDELIEIPFEPNLDLWDLLEGDSKSISYSNSADSEPRFSEFDHILNRTFSESDTPNTDYQDGSRWWWTVYLENELGL